MKTKWFSLASVLLVAILLISACGATPEPTEAPQVQPTEEVAAQPTEEVAAQPTEEEAAPT
jgi:hypothetical protein